MYVFHVSNVVYAGAASAERTLNDTRLCSKTLHAFHAATGHLRKRDIQEGIATTVGSLVCVGNSKRSDGKGTPKEAKSAGGRARAHTSTYMTDDRRYGEQGTEGGRSRISASCV